MPRCLIVLLALSIPPAKGLSAQLPPDRPPIEELRDSLAHVTDSLSLKGLEAATIQVAKQHRDDPLVHVRLGFIAHRLGEIANTKSHYDDAAGEFEWAAELRPGWPYPWYGLGLAELAQGEHAVIAIENMRQQLGKDYLSKAALTLTYNSSQRPTDRWRIYYAGARLERSPEALALYLADLSVVTHHDELAPFDDFTSPATRAAWLERFWLQRDVDEARDPGERLGEHYRRWFYAWHNFRLVSRHRHYDITERYRTDQLDFDDRGVIYLRHGPPDKRATYPRVLDRLEPNETWLYRRPDGDL